MAATLRDVLDLFASVTDPADRTNLLIDYADRFRTVPPSVATRPYDRAHLVPHCESEAYVWALRRPDGTMSLHFAVDNPSGVSARALASILESTLSGRPATDIAQISPDIVEQIFRQNISMGKGLGLMSMVQAVRALAAQAAKGAS